jgi:hypothetical protein
MWFNWTPVNAFFTTVFLPIVVVVGGCCMVKRPIDHQHPMLLIRPLFTNVSLVIQDVKMLYNRTIHMIFWSSISYFRSVDDLYTIFLSDCLLSGVDQTPSKPSYTHWFCVFLLDCYEVRSWSALVGACTCLRLFVTYPEYPSSCPISGSPVTSKVSLRRIPFSITDFLPDGQCRWLLGASAQFPGCLLKYFITVWLAHSASCPRMQTALPYHVYVLCTLFSFFAEGQGSRFGVIWLLISKKQSRMKSLDLDLNWC